MDITDCVLVVFCLETGSCYAALATHYVDCISSHSPARAFPNVEMIRPEPYSLVETRLLGRTSLLC